MVETLHAVVCSSWKVEHARFDTVTLLRVCTVAGSAGVIAYTCLAHIAANLSVKHTQCTCYYSFIHSMPFCLQR